MTNLSTDEKMELRTIFDKEEKVGVFYRLWILFLGKLGLK